VRKIDQVGELGLIKKVREMVGETSGALVGIGDDAAAFKTSQGTVVVLTVDTFVENVHFDLSYFNFFQIGNRAAAATLSDIAAMGAKPLGLAVSLGVSSKLDFPDIEQIYEGILSLIKRYGVELWGGDTTKSSQFFLSLVAIGEAKPDTLAQRKKVKPGDLIAVTGLLGASAAGLLVLQNKLDSKEFKGLVSAHLMPQPRLFEGQILVSEGVKAMEDISDGLASELHHLAEESKVKIVVEKESLPLAQGVFEVAEALKKNPFEIALYGGEDYELVFSAEPSLMEKAKEALQGMGTVVVVIGAAQEGEGVFLKEARGLTPVGIGYDHLKKTTNS
jgi:thiamine-monophosphate kinase